MLDFFNKDDEIQIHNPLKITKKSSIEFNVGDLRGTGLWHFKKIIEFNISGRTYSRYLINSNLENEEKIIEAIKGNNDQMETYIYKMTDTVPFSEDFLDVAGQRYLNTPDGNEYIRCIMPDNEERIDGLRGEIKVYNIEDNKIERSSKVVIWDYERDVDGRSEFFNIEMTEENGLFRLFSGELVEDIFFKIYDTK